ncbi:RNA polymerase sigma factor [Cellulomonas sp. P4]|uniref:RNA polymerase sigma factor n=1 Tax=Cellulomonas sp. P4 TaxID=3142533 RepID=UPI0031BAB76D
MGTGGDEGAGPADAAGDDDAAAFAAAYRVLAPQVRGYARRQVPDGLAEDVVSETFLVVWRRWREAPRDPEQLRPWVFGVARHKILHVREQHGRGLATLSRVAALEPTRPAPGDPADALAAADRARRLLAALPPAEGEAMALTVWAGLTPTEAAEVLGCSVTALTSRLSRARARLGAVLAADDPDGAGLGTADLTTTDRTTTDRTTRTAGTVSPGRADQERRGR